MKARTDFHRVNLATGEKTRSIVGEGQRIDETVAARQANQPSTQEARSSAQFDWYWRSNPSNFEQVTTLDGQMILAWHAWCAALYLNGQHSSASGEGTEEVQQLAEAYAIEQMGYQRGAREIAEKAAQLANEWADEGNRRADPNREPRPSEIEIARAGVLVSCARQLRSLAGASAGTQTPAAPAGLPNASPPSWTQPTPKFYEVAGESPLAALTAQLFPTDLTDQSTFGERVAGKMQNMLSDNYTNSYRIVAGIIDQELRAALAAAGGGSK